MCIVHRSSGLMSSLYGPNFQYTEKAVTRNRLTGVLTHFSLALTFLIIAFPPTRWLLQKFIRQPGEGSTKEMAEKEWFELRAIATADQPDSTKPKKAKGRFAHQGNLYWFTGLLMSEAAMVILRNEEGLVKKWGGGVLTPAVLGKAYVEGCQKAGCVVETEMMDE